MKNISRFLTAFGLSFVFTLALSQPVWAENNADLPTEKILKSELADAQKLPDGDEKTNNVATIQTSLDFLQQIQTQQKNNNDLQDTLIDADSEIQKNSADLQNLKKQLSTPSNTDYASQSLANLQAQVEKLTNQQQDAQSALSAVNTQLAGQSSVSERAQTALTDNVKRTQELNQKLADPTTNSLLKQQIQLELQLIELKNTYNQVLLKNSDQLTVLYQSRYELLNARVQALQKQIAAIQDVINQKNLAKTQNQVEQAQQQSQNVEQNPLIQKELNLNAQLSQYLLEQTAKTNTLTQDELRMRNVLDNLTQTQRTIDEQISALQGTLVLSRIIQQQKQKLPTNLNIQGLSKQIADLRVKIFDITQKRNELYDIDAYISKIEQDENKSFTPAEKAQLASLLTERRKVASDLIKSLNNQLNLAISLELTQQQITQISDQIQSKLDQQSFWVKSNNPINLDWFKKLPMSLKAQFDGIGKKLGFPTNFDNLPYLLTYVFILFVIGGLIFKFKESIKQRLSVINGEINKLRSDSQWHTPLALFYTALLSLSGTLWFLAACQLLGFFFVKNPQEFWEWSLSMAGYWWFFSFVLAILRPNGILVRHFGFAKESAASLQDVTKRIIVSVVLLLNTSIFSNVMDTGLANDVLGEINTIVALLFCIVIIAPRFVRTEKSLSSSTTDQRDRTLLKIMRILLQLVPVILIALIALGYYYTALNLITHIINTYIAWVVWSLVRHTIYRGVTVASRRLAYRRLQEKRQQKQQDLMMTHHLMMW